MVTEIEVLEKITDFFVVSHDFNGISLSRLSESLNQEISATTEHIRHLICQGKVDLAFASNSGNPHIKRVKDLPCERQIAKLEGEPANSICAYPSQETASNRIDLADFSDRPFTRRLALAESQLTPVFFELHVLEKYFRDPRYSCQFSDRDGTISIADDHYFSEQTSERDKISLQTFGIGYNSEKHRVVVVFLRYLSDLSPEHQQSWQAHALSNACTMNSDYERASIWGQWPKYYSAYEAFLEEQVEINKIVSQIGWLPFFRKTFGDDRPLEFSPMLRPTRRNFLEFAHSLDKLLSENINRDFFRGKVPLEELLTRDNGVVERQMPGTISLLKKWIATQFHHADGIDVSEEIVAPLRDVRKQRQPTAHALQEDEYDLEYPTRQDELVGNSVIALRKLRWALMAHPSAKEYAPPEWLDGDKIVFF